MLYTQNLDIKSYTKEDPIGPFALVEIEDETEKVLCVCRLKVGLGCLCPATWFLRSAQTHQWECYGGVTW